MKIVVAGGSGFIGTSLVRELASAHDLAVLSRNPERVAVGRGVRWDPAVAGAWQDEVASANVVVNLAGENVGAGRWTEGRKRAIHDSRVVSTSAIVEALRAAPAHPRVLVNASAVGIYGSRGDEELDESSAPGSGFLADVVRDWEAAARGAEEVARVVLLRFGVVLAPEGGALEKMLLPFRLFAGGPAGSGQQWMSWVSSTDAVRAIRWAIDTPAARAAYNLTSPLPVRNFDFARTAGRILRRPSFLPAPAPALRLALGSEMAEALLLGSQRVVPRRLEREGFTFSDRELEPALRRMLT